MPSTEWSPILASGARVPAGSSAVASRAVPGGRPMYCFSGAARQNGAARKPADNCAAEAKTSR